ncbi:MAG: hypothetical protein WA151_16625, partial [Desulfatirhabdiaceae bacterium]
QPAEMLNALSAHKYTSAKIYLVTGNSGVGVPWTKFFALWADFSVDLEGLCLDMSKSYSATLCIVWKSEHGGVAGYAVYRDGQKTCEERDSGENYLLLPAKGAEMAFQKPLGLDSGKRLLFPEILFDGNETCYLLDLDTGSLKALAQSTVTELLEDELDVEPVLPMEL